jgi:hypothetical protein
LQDDNKIFWKMKNDLTTGAWQNNIWRPINIILSCTSDVSLATSASMASLAWALLLLALLTSSALVTSALPALLAWQTSLLKVSLSPLTSSTCFKDFSKFSATALGGSAA